MNRAHFRTIGILGTDLDVTIARADHDTATKVNENIVRTMRALESTLSIYDERSEFSRWRSGEIDETSNDTRTVIALALEWHKLSGGAFDPFVGDLSFLWTRTREPSPLELEAALDTLRAPRVSIDDGRLLRIGDTSGFDANAIAKGWIIDRALERVWTIWPDLDVCIVAGGDLAWRGVGTWTVGIENPLRPYDNEPPLMMIDLAAGAIATSGSARRHLGNTKHSHLIDPRSGRPATALAGTSVIAESAAAADAAATSAAVMTAQEAVDWLSKCDHVQAGLVICATGEILQTSSWPA